MKQCSFTNNNYFLCEHSQRRGSDVWFNFGHPCIHSKTGVIDMVIFCTCESKNVKRSNLRQDSHEQPSEYQHIGEGFNVV